jgi:hypothetical protein
MSGGAHQRYEILNFSVGGYGLFDALYVIRHVMPEFSPDMVIYVVHPDEAYRVLDRLRRRLKDDALIGVTPSTRLGNDYAPLLAALQGSGMTAESYIEMLPEEFHQRLEPYRNDLLVWAYSEMVQASRNFGAQLVFVLIPLTEADFTDSEREMLTAVARQVGGEVVDLRGVFDNYEANMLKVAEFDHHPNVLGHRLIANRFYDELARRAAALGLSQSVERNSDGVSSESPVESSAGDAGVQ